MILNYLFSRILEEMLHYQKAHFYKKKWNKLWEYDRRGKDRRKKRKKYNDIMINI